MKPGIRFERVSLEEVKNITPEAIGIMSAKEEKQRPYQAKPQNKSSGLSNNSRSLSKEGD
jgi:hypothetical protein